jgi:ribosome recycling factor
MKIEIRDYEEKMKKSVSSLETEYKTISAGRASAAVLDRVQVEYFGSNMPVNQVAEIKMPDPRTLLITPWDASCLKNIEKAILASDIGINPQNDGRIIRLVFPQLTEERRRDLCKDVKKLAEDARIAIRSIRRDSLDKLKKMEKASEITEDDLKFAEKKLQDITDKYIKDIEKLSEEKEKDIMEI